MGRMGQEDEVEGGKGDCEGLENTLCDQRRGTTKKSFLFGSRWHTVSQGQASDNLLFHILSFESVHSLSSFTPSSPLSQPSNLSPYPHPFFPHLSPPLSHFTSIVFLFYFFTPSASLLNTFEAFHIPTTS